MRKNNNNQRGITLIALVITIIVLLILAGVAISMLSGENGILNQAANAKTETDAKSIEEQVKLAAMDALMRGDDLTSIESLDDLNNALVSQGLSEKATGDATTGYTVEAGEKTYKITTTGAVKEKSIVTDITAANYGDVITGYSINDVEDWKVFLNDGNNVWIITSSYGFADSETHSKVGMSSYGAFWETAPSKYTGYDNAKCAASLADPANWTAYVDESLAIKAMGGPTIEMFAKSYNAKYPDGTNGIIDYQLETTASNEGYKVGWKKDESVTYDYTIDGLMNDELYCDYNARYG